jgi:hypothetical protein
MSKSISASLTITVTPASATPARQPAARQTRLIEFFE